MDVGHHFKLHTSAPGKAILAYTEETERSKIIDDIEYVIYNENTISERKQFEDELVRVREKAMELIRVRKLLLCIVLPHQYSITRKNLLPQYGSQVLRFECP